MFIRLLGVLLCAVCLAQIHLAQNVDFERDRHKSILKLVKEDVKKNYYDPTFRGRDIEADYQKAVEKIGASTSIGQMTAIIAEFMVDFDDWHLFFLPPGKMNKTEYGFSYRIAGGKCFVVHVDKRSDAEKKGLQRGDEIFALEGYAPTRESLWKMRYFYGQLRPKPALTLDVTKPDGRQMRIMADSKITQGKRVLNLTGQDINQVIREAEDAERKQTRQYFFDKLEGVFIWKMPSFSLGPNQVDDLMDRARKSKAIIFDLRGNSGGRVDMLLRLIGNIFPEDLKVGDEKKRKETKEIIAKSRGKDAFDGRVIVLIDSGSASASEVFSKVIQLEKRGQIFGDRSAGAVMESRYFGRQLGLDTVIFFGSSITVADLIMKDGKSLEKVGVTPDVTVIPTGQDLALRRDAGLAKAIESLGISITPEAAGAIFPDIDDED